MRRGTRVGQAYVAVTADGSGINEEIVDSVDEAGKDIDDKGREHGDKYGEGFSDGFLDRMKNRVSKRLSTVMDGKTVGGRAGDEAGDSFVDRMSDKVKDLGDRLGHEISDRIASNPEQVRRGINRAFDDDFADRLGDRLGSRMMAGLSEAIDRQSAGLADALDRAVSGNGSDRNKKGGLGDIVGSIFGKGSRSNILNLLGSTIGNVVTLTEKIGQFASGAVTGFRAASDGASVFQRITAAFSGGSAASGLTGVFTKFIATGPMVVVVAGAVLVAMSALASVIGALVAIATALVSTIASALVGALLVAAPLLGALAAAGGLVVAAFTSMTNAQKDYLFGAFQPFKAALTGIGQIIITEFTRPLYNGMSAIQVWSRNLQNALVPLAGVAQSTAGAFAVAGNIITASLSGPGFQRFFAVLAVELPGIVTNLARALGGFLNGVGGLFAALLPTVSTFSRYLESTAGAFSRWANSAQGQNAIVDFANRAIDSIKSLWGFVKEFSGFLSDVFFSRVSQRAGNSIFDSLANTFKGFRREFAKAAQSGDLEKWFNDAINFGGQLWQIVQALYKLFIALYNSGVLESVGNAINWMAGFIEKASTAVGWLVDAFGYIPGALSAVMGPLGTLYTAIKGIGDLIGWVLGLAGVGGSPASTASTAGAFSDFYTTTNVPGVTPNGIMGPWAPGTSGNPMPANTLDDLISSGNTALNNTYESMGGYMPDPTDAADKDKDKTRYGVKQKDKDWKNPYIEFANSMLSEIPGVAKRIRDAFKEARSQLDKAFIDAKAMLRDVIPDLAPSILAGVADASSALGSSSVIDSFSGIITNMGEAAASAMESAQNSAQDMIDSAYASADDLIAQAKSARDEAARALASASTPAEAKAALEALRKADAALALAYRKGDELIEQARRNADNLIASATATQNQIDAASSILSAQSVVNIDNVLALAQGLGAENATLADYAQARLIVANELAKASQAVLDAISLRDNYAKAVTDAAQSYAALTTAIAKTVDGVQQSLTAVDITDNLQTRLTKIKKFQETLRQLRAQGLSDAAYKQLLDAGVETGSTFADAILEGGQGAVSEVNGLTQQIEDATSILGNEAANNMYQAGVDAAQGLVDGLLSLSAELESAATALGNAIAQAIRDALGIASPSRVLIADMEHVGDGGVIGLLNQRNKLASASAALASAINVSPQAAATAAAPVPVDGVDGVSGNGQRPINIDLDIHTPTEDPKAVANEAINELVGALP